MSKDEKYKYWIAALVILIIVSFLYGTRVYNSFFASRPSYLYDPVTDRIFSVELRPSIDPTDKWEALIPFKSFLFLDTGYSEYLGKLTFLLSKTEAERNLLRTNPSAFRKKIIKDSEEFIDAIKSKGLEIWKIDFFPHWDMSPNEFLPDHLSKLITITEKKSPDGFMVDAWVAHTIILYKGTKISSPEVELIRNAILIRGRAAYELSDQI